MASNEQSIDDVFARFSLQSTDDKETIPRTLRSENPSHVTQHQGGDIMASGDTELKYSNLDFGKCLGSGATSKVYQARLLQPYHGHKEVAVKCIFSDLNEEEIKILTMFKDKPHPNIIQFLAYIKHEREHLVVTELAPRGALYACLRQSPDDTIPLFVVQKWVKDIASGIKFLHNNNVLHRDIKSLNCLLYQDCLVKICDFGIARATEASITVKTSHLKGSARWMAPEMLASKAFSKPSDIYAFGMVVLEICTRKLPFAELDGLQLLVRDAKKQPNIPESCPGFLRRLMLQCWEAERQERPTIDDIVRLLEKECQDYEGCEMDLIRQWEEENFPQEHQILPLVSNEEMVIKEKYDNQERVDNEYAERETVVFDDNRQSTHETTSEDRQESFELSQHPEWTDSPSDTTDELSTSEYTWALSWGETAAAQEPLPRRERSNRTRRRDKEETVGIRSKKMEHMGTCMPPLVSRPNVGVTEQEESVGLYSEEMEQIGTCSLCMPPKDSIPDVLEEEEASVGVYQHRSEEVHLPPGARPKVKGSSEFTPQLVSRPNVLAGITEQEACVGVYQHRSEEVHLPPGARAKGSSEATEACVEICGTGPQVSPGAEVPLKGTSKRVQSNKKCKLSDYTCDLQVTISRDGFSATPLNEGGFVYMWAGVKATHGVRSGKVCFEVKVTEELDASHHTHGSGHLHVVRVGWSTADSSLQLGVDKLSYGYGGTAQKSCWEVFRTYGKKFGKGDVITSYVDFTGKVPIISYAKNGEDLGLAHTIKGDLQGHALYPHVLMKNAAVEVNLGQKKPSFPAKEGFTFLRNLPEKHCVLGPQPPATKEDCEVLMMIGLSGSGKTTWAKKHCKENPHKQYVILGTNQLIEDMRIADLGRDYSGRFQKLIEPATECYNKLLEIASQTRHNYILDQTNLYPSARRRKIGHFEDYFCKAIVVVPSRKTYEERCEKQMLNQQKRDIPDEEVKKMKANFKLPEGERELNYLFSEVQYVELQHDEATSLLNEYKKEVLLS
ncbi:uncharacterized protein [Amphiura filiformis]|uniref:uncharacterized protein n=1 Tax=Amphiura filiformis TaxID=82378 RepID=UPI003B20FC63